jgi:hypothetical protein
LKQSPQPASWLGTPISTLAHLSRADLLPEAWMANERTQQTRLLTRLRIALGRQRAKAKNQLQAVLHQEGS